MSLDYSVEVTVKEGDTSTQRGALLEQLAKRVLTAQQFDHISTNVRFTGCELDLIAENNQTGAKILVECKAYRDRPIAADVLTKIWGNVDLGDYSAGWLITTSSLTKDAEGLRTALRSKSLEKRQKLLIYDPKDLCELLIKSGRVVDPSVLRLPEGQRVLPDRTLLITDVGQFWACQIVGKQSGVTDTVIVFDAPSGARIVNESLVAKLKERDSNLRNLEWIASEEETVAKGAFADASLKEELDSIAIVPMAEDWSDYRPARPEDFVGRDSLQREIIAFLEDVRTNQTTTRLVAIKAPSGWGKSSFVNKLKEVSSKGRNKTKYYVYPVDCRTAYSPRYPELALKKCFDQAIEDGFIECGIDTVNIASAGQPFADETVKSALQSLEKNQRTLVLFFDQFEEIITKQELAELFQTLKRLASAVESANEQVVLGFSWKTDGTTPVNHPAYSVWHSLADRRKEFELPLFSTADISKLLGGLSTELKQPISLSLRKLLAENCQGYPWLLKKLCIHVFQVLKKQPEQQRELLERALDVESLFNKDLEDLGAKLVSCLELDSAEFLPPSLVSFLGKSQVRQLNGQFNPLVHQQLQSLIVLELLAYGR